jgi:hypothetical protein
MIKISPSSKFSRKVNSMLWNFRSETGLTRFSVARAQWVCMRGSFTKALIRLAGASRVLRCSKLCKKLRVRLSIIWAKKARVSSLLLPRTQLMRLGSGVERSSKCAVICCVGKRGTGTWQQKSQIFRKSCTVKNKKTKGFHAGRILSR